MTIDYNLDENDYLTHQLFVASKSDRIKKRRLRSKGIVPLIYIVIGLVFLFEDKFVLTISFFIFALLWFFIYPLWERQYYVKHYKGFIKDNYKARLGKSLTLDFNNDFILAKDNVSESKVLTTELKEIDEIPSLIFVRLKGGQSFILPKNKIANIDEVRLCLKELATYLQINYNIDEDWKWK